MVDGAILLAEHCPRGAEAFALAERWRSRMLEQEWEQVTPRSVHQRSPERTETALPPTSLRAR